MILSLCGCTAACLVNLGFGGSWGKRRADGGWDGWMWSGPAACPVCPCLWEFPRGCCVLLHGITLLHGFGQQRARLLPAERLSMASGMSDTHTHPGTRERAHPHPHRTAVLALVSAQRSCSEVRPMDAR